MSKIPTEMREEIRSELVLIADRLVKKLDITIPEARRVIKEILDVSV
jgi:polyhydroxyalkanoate synthesis regulator phasin